MKTLEEYMALPYKMEVIPDSEEPGYIVNFPELPGCITCADTLEKALENAVDAKREWLFASLEDGYPIPEPASIGERSDRFEVLIPMSIRPDLTRASRRIGMDVDQFCTNVLTRAIS